MTVFGPSWDALQLEDLEAFLQDAPAEPLNWEAKADLNHGSVRKQVCGFLILGAQEKAGGGWTLDGLRFPGQDPPTAVTDLLTSGGVTPYPDGLDVRSFAVGDGKHVAVIRIPPVATPPCMTHGAVFERVAGKTIPVTDPARLASLFARGDGAKQAGIAKAEQLAGRMIREAGADPVIA
jgi:hypothetical protein